MRLPKHGNPDITPPLPAVLRDLGSVNFCFSDAFNATLLLVNAVSGNNWTDDRKVSVCL